MSLYTSASGHCCQSEPAGKAVDAQAASWPTDLQTLKATESYDLLVNKLYRSDQVNRGTQLATLSPPASTIRVNRQSHEKRGPTPCSLCSSSTMAGSTMAGYLFRVRLDSCLENEHCCEA